MKLSIKAGATSQSVNVFVQNSGSTTGAGLTGLAYNTSGLTAYYSFSGASAGSVVISLVTLATTTTAWATGGFIQIDSTNMPGWYRLDLPNAVLAASSGRSVAIHLQGAASMAPCPVEIELTGWDNQDAVHGGISALPNTACTTNSSLLTSGTGAAQIQVDGSGNAYVNLNLIKTQTVTCAASVTVGAFVGNATHAITVDASGDVTFNNASIATVTTVTNQLTAAAIATGVWQDATAGDFTTASSIGKCLYISNVIPGGAGGHFIAGTNAATVVTTSFTTTFTGNLTGSVGSVTGAVGSVTGLTTATIATAVWTDTTAGDFTTSTSPGKIIFTQLGGAFTSTSSSVFSTASLVNAPTGGSAPTVAQIATAVWEDTTAGGDFGTAGSIGKLIVTTGLTVLAVTNGVTVTTNNDKTGYSLTTAPPTAAAIATAVWEDTTSGGDFGTAGSIGKLIVTTGLTVLAVTNGVTVTMNNDKTGYSMLMTQALSAARALDTIADTSLTLNDALQCAVAGAVGIKDASSGTNLVISTPHTATVLRTYTITTTTIPTTVPDKVA